MRDELRGAPVWTIRCHVSAASRSPYPGRSAVLSLRGRFTAPGRPASGVSFRIEQARREAIRVVAHNQGPRPITSNDDLGETAHRRPWSSQACAVSALSWASFFPKTEETRPAGYLSTPVRRYRALQSPKEVSMRTRTSPRIAHAGVRRAATRHLAPHQHAVDFALARRHADVATRDGVVIA